MLGIINKHNRIPCCVVWIAEGIERIVPVAATDRAAEPPHIFPAPLNVIAVQQLRTTFERITFQSMEEEAGGSNRRRKQEKRSGVEPIDATTRCAENGADADLDGAYPGAAANRDTDPHSGRTLPDSDLGGGGQ
jgi:hypothetical protein